MANDNKTNTPAVDPEELVAAEREAETGGNTYTHKFTKPFEYMGKEHRELRFDWDSLTGADDLAIEAEMQALGKAVVAPEFSGEYQIRMAAKACAEAINADAFKFMSFYDARKIKKAARSFLLK